MPTCYTDPIVSKDQSFEDYALHCAGQFSLYCYHEGGALPEKLPPPGVAYYDKQIEEHTARLEFLQSTSQRESELSAVADYERDLASYRKLLVNYSIGKQKYRAMLAKVQAWTPPSARHENLKKFMIKQIEESIPWDYSTEHLIEPTLQTGAAWLRMELDRAQTGLAYAVEYRQKMLANHADDVAWIKQLRESLKRG